MDPAIPPWFRNNIDILYFLYGAAFAALGLAASPGSRWKRFIFRFTDSAAGGTVFDNTPHCVANIGLDGRLLEVNRPCREVYGLTAAYAGREAAAVLAGSAPEFSAAVYGAAAGGAFEVRYTSPKGGGGKIWWEASIFPVRDRRGRVESVLCTARNISEQVAATEKRRRGRETQAAINDILNIAIENVSLETILERVLDRILAVPWLGLENKGSILMTDPLGHALVAKAQRGLEGAVKGCGSLPSGNCLCVRSAVTGEAVFASEIDASGGRGCSARRPNARYCLPIKARNKTLGVLNLYVRDGRHCGETGKSFLESVCAIIAKTAEYRGMEGSIYQMQKMESLGRFAGAIAHDFNNILSGMKGFNALALETVPESHEAHLYIRETAASIERGVKLTQQILAFSRKQPGGMSEVNLNKLIAGMEPILKVIFQHRIKIRLNLDPGLPEIRGNQGQLEQILINLAVNARDAMPHNGEFSIRTSRTESESGAALPRESAGTVRLSVADTGSGIPEELAEHVFEPFFTTKPEGKGTGLGLSTVYSLVKLHKGTISLSSVVGRGTTFDINFPASGSAAICAVPGPGCGIKA